MKVGIVIDSWKLAVFTRRLAEAGYKWTEAGDTSGKGDGLCTLTVHTETPTQLHAVVRDAQRETAAIVSSGRPH